jgi:hypothetical protein
MDLFINQLFPFHNISSDSHARDGRLHSTEKPSGNGQQTNYQVPSPALKRSHISPTKQSPTVYTAYSPVEAFSHARTAVLECIGSLSIQSKRPSGNPTSLDPFSDDSDENLARKVRLESNFADARTNRDRRRIDKQLYALQVDQNRDVERRRSFFNAAVLESRARTLEAARESGDMREMLHLIRTQLTRDLGSLCNQALFDHPGARTEKTVLRYQKAIIAVVDRIVAACKANDKRLDKRLARKTFHRTLR